MRDAENDITWRAKRTCQVPKTNARCRTLECKASFILTKYVYTNVEKRLKNLYFSEKNHIKPLMLIVCI